MNDQTLGADEQKARRKKRSVTRSIFVALAALELLILIGWLVVNFGVFANLKDVASWVFGGIAAILSTLGITKWKKMTLLRLFGLLETQMIVAVYAVALVVFLFLSLRPHTVSITTFLERERAAGVEIWLNGNYRGATDSNGELKIPDVATGTHVLKYVLEHYNPKVCTVRIAGIEPEPRRHNFSEEERSTGNLYVRSFPSGAEIWIDDTVNTGRMTPDNVPNLAAGDHVLVVKKAGHASYRSAVTIRANATTTKDSVTLHQETCAATISVRTVPSEAEVYLDGSFVRTTPAMIEGLRVREYRLELRRQCDDPDYGYLWDTSITTKRNETVRIDKHLDGSNRTRLNDLVVRSSPESEIHVNGKYVSLTNGNPIKAYTRRISITLKREGYRPKAFIVNDVTKNPETDVITLERSD